MKKDYDEFDEFDEFAEVFNNPDGINEQEEDIDIDDLFSDFKKEDNKSDDKNAPSISSFLYIKANAGNPISQYKVGMEWLGYDKEKALMWLEKSAAQGYEDAIKELAKLQK